MAETQQHDRQVDRPLTVTLVILGVFVLGLANIWRALGLISQRNLLTGLGISFDPLLQALIAIVWAVVFVWMAAKIWQRWAPARYLMPLALLLYGASQRAITFVISQEWNSLDSWAATAVTYGAMSLFVVWALNRKPARKYF